MTWLESIKDMLSTFPPDWKGFTIFVLVCAGVGILFVAKHTYRDVMNTIMDLRVKYTLTSTIINAFICITGAIIFAAGVSAFVVVSILIVELIQSM